MFFVILRPERDKLLLVAGIKTMLPAVALAAVMAAGCARSPRTVAPTGWRSFGEPYDSLTLLLETGFVGDAGADSLGNLARRRGVAPAAPGAP